MAKHNLLLFSLIILTAVSYIVTVIFNALSAISNNGVFATIAKNVSDKYSLDITPAGWTFSIWSVIYIWNGAWIVYAVSTLFRRNSMGYIYVTPGLHPPEFFVIWIVNNIVNIGWLFLWDQEILIFANVFIVLLPISLYIMLAISYRNCYKYGAWMWENNRVDLWCTRILVHNGLATYATWTTAATCLNFGIVLKYYVKIEDPAVSSITLCLIFLALVFWLMLETFVFEKYVRYTFTIYPVAIVASAGVYTGSKTSSDLSTVNMINALMLIYFSFLSSSGDYRTDFLCMSLALYIALHMP
uniref:Uncharacterized protein n=1 Tax=Xenopus tropicalis TaxID=8364 RepID=A0A1B8YA49_XENTR